MELTQPFLGSSFQLGFDSKLFFQADNYNKRRLRGEEVAVVEYDALIASRKEARLAEGGVMVVLETNLTCFFILSIPQAS